jgi:hypothetical protein
MIDRTELTRLAPAARAELIYAEAKSALGARLWQAALGRTAGDRAEAAGLSGAAPGLDLDALVRALDPPPVAALPSPAAAVRPRAPEPLLPDGFAAPVAPVSAPEGLGANARHGPALAAAAARTGLPPAALAAIVDAEAAHGRDGSWNTHSRNPRSSAAGLGQFLSGTWSGEAERPGTWLNRVAHERGWLGRDGKVSSAARGALLALRYDATASIEATADYARRNLDRLQDAGVRIGDGAREIARAAYLGHHLGPGDAVRFLGTNGLDPARARVLLAAQVGSAEASRRIAAAPSPTAAHRAWLLGFMDNRVRPDRFSTIAG